MPRGVRATLEISVVGTTIPILNALAMLQDALIVDGHRWTEDERAVLDLAVDLCRASANVPTIVRGTTVHPLGEG